MKKEITFTKCSLWVLMISFIVLLNEFIQLVPTHKTKLEGILLLWGPTLFAVVGEILAILGLIKKKSKMGFALIIINFIILFWPFIYWKLGVYILGV